MPKSKRSEFNVRPEERLDPYRDFYKRLGTQIALLRLRKVMNQAQIAKLLRMPRTSYGQIENGTVTARVHQLDAIARVLDTTAIAILQKVYEQEVYLPPAATLVEEPQQESA